MKQQLIQLCGIAAISFTLSFITGMSFSVAHQERQNLAQLQAEETLAAEAALALDEAGGAFQ